MIAIHAVLGVLAAAMAIFPLAAEPRSGEGDRMRTAMLNGDVGSYLEGRRGELGGIPAERRLVLDEMSRYIASRSTAGQPVRLVFVCTHNSRRSHMAQLWAAAAARAYGIELSTYSGGTESTAFNPRAVDAMRRAGFRIDKTTEDANPVYHARMGDDLPPMTCFSKAYDHAPNPKTEFAAVMVCGEADRACPLVPGASGRFTVPFVDPKVSDGTPEEAATYDERCAQVAREMVYVMSRVGV